MLSKSDLLSLRQCSRKLWLEKKRPDLVPDENSSQDRRAVDGHLVNEAARQALGPAYLWPKGGEDKNKAMVDALAQIAAAPGTPVVEMPLVHQDLYVRVDALLTGESGGYVVQETKSSTFPLKKDKVTPANPDDHYLDDVAIQAWVLESCGLPMERAELNLLNSPWIYLGDGDYTGLFRPYDVTELIETRKAMVPTWLQAARDVVAQEDMPPLTTGTHCKKPHDCSFKAFCQSIDPPGPAHPIELLPDSAGKSLAKKLRAQGHLSLLDPKPEEFVGAAAELYRRIQQAHAKGEAVLVPGAETFMANLAYPRYYFDFEGIDLPVPRWAGVRPYEQIAFQWSCHIERSPGVFEHRAFLDLSGKDPTLACIEKMREVIDPADGGPIIVFYQTYEKGRMEGMGERHPEHAELMKCYISRLVDLHPLVKAHFYDPRMRGSFSIKKVLPVIAPNLDYKELEGVQEGTGAQIAYLNLCFDGLPADKWARLKSNALAYCEQDTWAMVEIGYFLEGKPRPGGIRPPPAAC